MPDSAIARALVLERPRRLVLRKSHYPPSVTTTRSSASRHAGCAAPTTSSTPASSRADSRSCPATRRSGSSRRSGRRRPQRWQVEPKATGSRSRCFQSCRQCAACLAGQYQRCERHGLRDMYGFIPVDTRARPLGRLRRVSVPRHRTRCVLPVPDSARPGLATLFNPFGAGIRWGVDGAGDEAGDVVAVLGPGMRGLCRRRGQGGRCRLCDGDRPRDRGTPNGSPRGRAQLRCRPRRRRRHRRSRGRAS